MNFSIRQALILEYNICLVRMLVDACQPKLADRGPEIFVYSILAAIDDLCFELVGISGSAENSLGCKTSTSAEKACSMTKTYSARMFELVSKSSARR